MMEILAAVLIVGAIVAAWLSGYHYGKSVGWKECEDIMRDG